MSEGSASVPQPLPAFDASTEANNPTDWEDDDTVAPWAEFSEERQAQRLAELEAFNAKTPPTSPSTVAKSPTTPSTIGSPESKGASARIAIPSVKAQISRLRMPFGGASRYAPLRPWCSAMGVMSGRLALVRHKDHPVLVEVGLRLRDRLGGTARRFGDDHAEATGDERKSRACAHSTAGVEDGRPSGATPKLAGARRRPGATEGRLRRHVSASRINNSASTKVWQFTYAGFSRIVSDRSWRPSSYSTPLLYPNLVRLGAREAKFTKNGKSREKVCAPYPASYRQRLLSPRSSQRTPRPGLLAGTRAHLRVAS